jgi:hypothetical protein
MNEEAFNMSVRKFLKSFGVLAGGARRSVIEITSCPALRTALTTAKSQLSSATRRIMLGFD